MIDLIFDIGEFIFSLLFVGIIVFIFKLFYTFIIFAFINAFLSDCNVIINFKNILILAFFLFLFDCCGYALKEALK